MLLSMNVSGFERECEVAPVAFSPYVDRFNYLSIEARLPFDEGCAVCVNLPMRPGPGDQATCIVEGPNYRDDTFIFDMDEAQAIASGDRRAAGVEASHYEAMLDALRALLADPDVAFYAGLLDRAEYDERCFVINQRRYFGI